MVLPNFSDLYDSLIETTFQQERRYCKMQVTAEVFHTVPRDHLLDLMRQEARHSGYEIPSFIEPRISARHGIYGVYTFYFEWIEVVPSGRSWTSNRIEVVEPTPPNTNWTTSRDLEEQRVRQLPPTLRPSSGSWDEGPGMTLDELLGKIDSVLED